MPKSLKQFKKDQAASRRNKDHITATYIRKIEHDAEPDHTGRIKVRAPGKMYGRSLNGRK